MIILEIDPTYGICFPEARVSDEVAGMLREAEAAEYTTNTVTFSLGQQELLNEFRIMVKTGQIDAEQIRVHYGNEIVLVHPDGHLSNWPRGMVGDVVDKQLDVLII